MRSIQEIYSALSHIITLFYFIRHKKLGEGKKKSDKFIRERIKDKLILLRDILGLSTDGPQTPSVRLTRLQLFFSRATDDLFEFKAEQLPLIIHNLTQEFPKNSNINGLLSEKQLQEIADVFLPLTDLTIPYPQLNNLLLLFFPDSNSIAQHVAMHATDFQMLVIAAQINQHASPVSDHWTQQISMFSRHKKTPEENVEIDDASTHMDVDYNANP